LIALPPSPASTAYATRKSSAVRLELWASLAGMPLPALPEVIETWWHAGVDGVPDDRGASARTTRHAPMRYEACCI